MVSQVNEIKDFVRYEVSKNQGSEHNYRPHYQNGYHGRPSNRFSTQSAQCYFCYQFGHYKRNCPVLKNMQMNAWAQAPSFVPGGSAEVQMNRVGQSHGYNHSPHQPAQSQMNEHVENGSAPADSAVSN